jgi:hypothetical protein
VYMEKYIMVVSDKSYNGGKFSSWGEPRRGPFHADGGEAIWEEEMSTPVHWREVKKDPEGEAGFCRGAMLLVGDKVVGCSAEHLPP